MMENELIKTEPKTIVTKTPTGTIINNRNSFENIFENQRFLKKETSETNTKSLLESGVYHLNKMVGNESIKTELETTFSEISTGTIINDNGSFDNGIALQNHINNETSETRQGNFILENGAYTVITVENYTIKTEPETSFSETPSGTITDDRTSYESDSKVQNLIKNKTTEITTENSIIKNESSISNIHKNMDTERRFACKFCDKKFQSLGTLKDHRLSHTDKKLYKCTKYNQRFSGKSTLKSHITRHTVEKFFKCTECDQCFSTKQALNYHLTRHTGVKPFSCTKCNQSFTAKQSLHLHMRRHTGEKPYSCTECNQSFVLRASLNYHMRRHTGEKPFTCADCGQSFSFKGALKRHMMRHTGEKPFSCAECNISFAVKHALSRHMRRHTGEKPYLCTECNQNFTAKRSLYNHMLRHTGKKPYTCTECSKSFSIKRSLCLHMKRHTGEKPYSCTECNKNFAVKEALSLHMKRHTGEKPYVCNDCGKRFIRGTELRSHSKTHIRPFACDQCEQKFKTVKQLEQHTKIHLSIHKREYELRKKKLKSSKYNDTYASNTHYDTRNHLDIEEDQTNCEVCDKEFDSIQTLNSHIFEVHKDQPESFRNIKRAIKLETNSSDSLPTKIYENDSCNKTPVVGNIATTDKYTEQTSIEGYVILPQFIKEEIPETSTEKFLLENEIYTDITVENESIKVESEIGIS